MKLILLSLFIFFSLSLSAQWTPTGKTEIWKTTIHDGKTTTTGYVKMKAMKWVPDPKDGKYKGWDSPREISWQKEGTVYDGAKKKIKLDHFGGSLKFVQPKTLKLMH